MILVTGATGTIGRRLVAELRERGVRVRAMTRDPAAARIEADEVVSGDLDRPDPALFAGVDALFLLSPPGPETAEREPAVLRAAAGVRRVVKLSAIAADDPATLTSAWHRPGERALRDGFADWTILRPSTFASNALAWAPAIRAGEAIPNPFGDGAQGVVDPADVAAVAAVVLTEDGHAGRTYTLTGPALITVPSQVAVIGKVLDREISTVDLDPAALPEPVAAGARFVRDGGNAVLTDDVAAVLGRPARSFEQWVISAW